LNNQLLQDYFAQHGVLRISVSLSQSSYHRVEGFTVLGIDYFFGDPIYNRTEDGFDRQAWMEKSKKQGHEAFPGWLKEVKAIYDTLLSSLTLADCSRYELTFRSGCALLCRR
jgi:hypothetical protein